MGWNDVRTCHEHGSSGFCPECAEEKARRQATHDELGRLSARKKLQDAARQYLGRKWRPWHVRSCTCWRCNE